MRPFAFQKAVFRAARGGLLQRERPPLARPCASAVPGGHARLRRRLAGTPSSGLAAGGRVPCRARPVAVGFPSCGVVYWRMEVHLIIYWRQFGVGLACLKYLKTAVARADPVSALATAEEAKSRADTQAWQMPYGGFRPVCVMAASPLRGSVLTYVHKQRPKVTKCNFQPCRASGAVYGHGCARCA